MYKIVGNAALPSTVARVTDWFGCAEDFSPAPAVVCILIVNEIGAYDPPMCTRHEVQNSTATT